MNAAGGDRWTHTHTETRTQTPPERGIHTLRALDAVVYAGFFSRFPSFVQYICRMFFWFWVLGLGLRSPLLYFPYKVIFSCVPGPLHQAQAREMSACSTGSKLEQRSREQPMHAASPQRLYTSASVCLAELVLTPPPPKTMEVCQIPPHPPPSHLSLSLERLRERFLLRRSPPSSS